MAVKSINLKSHYLSVYPLIFNLTKEVPLLNSDKIDTDSIQVSMDRLDFHLTYGITKLEIEKKFVKYGIPPKQYYSDGYHYLGIGGTQNNAIKFMLDKTGRSGPTFQIRSFHTNPSRFKSFQEFFDLFNLFLSRQDLAAATISTLHIAFDIDEMAKKEGERISERVKSGIENYKRKNKGKSWGRRPSLPRKKILELYDQGLNKNQIAKQLGIAYSSVFNVIKKAYPDSGSKRLKIKELIHKKKLS